MPKLLLLTADERTLDAIAQACAHFTPPLACRECADDEAAFDWTDRGPAPASQQNPPRNTKRRWTGTPPDKGTRYQITKPHTARGKRGSASKKDEAETKPAAPVPTATPEKGKVSSELIGAASTAPRLTGEARKARERLLKQAHATDWGDDAKEMLSAHPKGSAAGAVLSSLAKTPRDGLAWHVLADALEEGGADPSEVAEARVRGQLLSEADPAWWEARRFRTYASLLREQDRGIDDEGWANTHAPGERDDALRGLMREEADRAYSSHRRAKPHELYAAMAARVPDLSREEFRRVVDEWSGAPGRYGGYTGVAADGQLDRSSGTHHTHYTSPNSSLAGEFGGNADLVEIEGDHALDTWAFSDAPPKADEATLAALQAIRNRPAPANYQDHARNIDDVTTLLQPLPLREIRKVAAATFGPGWRNLRPTKPRMIQSIAHGIAPYYGGTGG